ncbi:Tripartite motif-containing protein 2 [Sarcoptes scabiei]|nr:Tripartite motif-containing protein 2 [Sarcoptes scabiei]
MEALNFYDPFHYTFQSELSQLMTTSTLVETVSINYDDFTEGFLTCGTCLYTYDAEEHTPKLLPCSHTVCKVCLEKIAATAAIRDPASSGNFRCPICRELIHLPRGGIMAFPPSFLVNQLLDLVNTKRREVIPKCSSHLTQELLYCEPCDLVFCNQCTGDKHDNQSLLSSSLSSSSSSSTPSETLNANIFHHNNRDHTVRVIPLSIAIKRMSEILLYKAQQCVSKLDESSKNVLVEMRRLDQNSDLTFEDINRTFQEVINIIDTRRQELLNSAKRITEEKRSILRDQLKSIELEKSQLEKECDRFKLQVETREISRKINDLRHKLVSVDTMLDPKENCFVRFEHHRNSTIENIQASIKNFGAIRTSNTFPPHCEARVEKVSINLRSLLTVATYDYQGHRQKFGGDPLSIKITHCRTSDSIPYKLNDNRDGTYEIQFIPQKSGLHSVKISIFERPIKNYPLEFNVSEHLNPLCIYGSRGSDSNQFCQPTGIAIDFETRFVFVLDTSNCRITKLLLNQSNAEPFEFVCHIEGKEFDNKAATGIAFCQTSRSLLVTNWRKRNIVKIDCDGRFVGEFFNNELQEPTYIAVCPNSGQILVTDNATNRLFLFDPDMKLIRIISDFINIRTKKSEKLGQISGICFHPITNQFLVVGTKMLLYSSSGDFLREIYDPNQSKSKTVGRYCGVAIDKSDCILAAYSDRNRNIIQVIDSESGFLKFIIDSNEAKLKRPSCLALTNDHHVMVVDLGNDCIKYYRYL